MSAMFMKVFSIDAIFRPSHPSHCGALNILLFQRSKDGVQAGCFFITPPSRTPLSLFYFIKVCGEILIEARPQLAPAQITNDGSFNRIREGL